MAMMDGVSSSASAPPVSGQPPEAGTMRPAAAPLSSPATPKDLPPTTSTSLPPAITPTSSPTAPPAAAVGAGKPKATDAKSAETASNIDAPSHVSNGAEALPRFDISATEFRGSVGASSNSHINITNNTYGAGAPGYTASWEDDLSVVSRIPEPNRQMLDADVERHADALHDKRLLLLFHLPHRQDEAVDAMRAVVRRLQQRHPGRPVFASSLNGGLRLESLRREGEWRQDRRDGIIYLYRSADPTAQGFFDGLENVDRLIDQLRRMNTHLALTVSAPAVAFRDHAQLSGRISMWVFDAPLPQTAAPAPVPSPITGELELAVALCAALFPGMAIAEFVALVDQLAPKANVQVTLPATTGTPANASGSTDMPTARPESESGIAPVAAPVTPPASRTRSRHERWWGGERDAVLAELGVQLLGPLANDGAEADSAEPGMLFVDAERRAHMPSRLFNQHPILLSQHLDVLMRHYLSPSASARFRAAYRRTLSRIDQSGVHRLTTGWLLRHFRESMQRGSDYAVRHAYSELMFEMPDSLHGESIVSQWIDGLADWIRAEERDLVRALNEKAASQPPAETEAGRALDFRDFWRRLMSSTDAQSAIDRVASRQTIAIDLLMSLTLRAPGAVAEALGPLLGDCDGLHAVWMSEMGLEDTSRAPVSLARVKFRELQGGLLHQAPRTWLALVESIVEAYASVLREARDDTAWQTQSPPSGQQRDGMAARGRSLAYDCFLSLISLFGQPKPLRLSPALHRALLEDDASGRLGRLIVSLLQLAPSADWREEDDDGDAASLASEDESIDIGSLLWLYKSLALATMAQGDHTPEQAAGRVAELIAPLRADLHPLQRLTLAEVIRLTVDRVYEARDAIPIGIGPRDTTQQRRRDTTRNLQAIQMVQRAFRGISPRAAA